MKFRSPSVGPARQCIILDRRQKRFRRPDLSIAGGDGGGFCPWLRWWQQWWNSAAKKQDLVIYCWWWLEPWNFYDFPFSWEFHHPNWRTQSIIFQRGWNHQSVMVAPNKHHGKLVKWDLGEHLPKNQWWITTNDPTKIYRWSLLPFFIVWFFFLRQLRSVF